MKVLLDTNIVLDVLLQRQEWIDDAQAIWDAGESGQLTCHVTATALTDIFYVCRRSRGWEDARVATQACLDTMLVITVDRTLLTAAINRPEADFEDAVVIAAAEAASVDAIITRDAAGFKDSPIAVMSPADLASRLQVTNGD
ncbi:MAG: PIN domain-containing protein [Planctomycetaceae bacterium]|nr:PIN domain-containing protein [Planctomycetaceae bacterium]